ncbi:MAG: tape measure protein [Syntrophomonas sp.]
MANKNYRIGILLTLHDKMTSALERIDGQAKKVEATTRRLDRMSISPTVRLIDRISGPINTIKSKIESLGRATLVGAGAAATGAVAGTGYSLNLAGEMEQSNIAMEYFMGSVKKGKQAVREMQVMAAKTPYEFPFLQESAIGLMGIYKDTLGVNQAWKESKRDIMAFGDAAGYTGAGMQGMELAMLGFRQIGMVGTLQMEELRQVTENLRIPMSLVAKEMGLTGDQMKDLGKQNISSSVAMEAIVRALEKNYAGGMDKLSKSYIGLKSTVKDNSRNIVTAFGTGMLDPVKRIFSDLIGSTDITSKKFEKTMKRIESAGKSVGLYSEKRYKGIKRFIQSLVQDEEFNKLDWDDKIKVVLDRMADAINKWMAGSGGKRLQEIFSKLAELAVKAWFTTVKKMFAGSFNSMTNGNMASGFGQLVIANVLLGGLLTKGGGFILKKGIENKLSKKTAAINAAKAASTSFDTVVAAGTQSARTASRTASASSQIDEGLKVMQKAQIGQKRGNIIPKASRPVVEDSLGILRRAQFGEAAADDTVKMMAEAQSNVSNFAPKTARVTRFQKILSLFKREPVMDEGLSIMRQAQGGRLSRILSPVQSLGKFIPSRVTSVSGIIHPAFQETVAKIPKIATPINKAIPKVAEVSAGMVKGTTTVLSRLEPVLKVAGKVAPWLAIGTEAYEVATAKDKTRAFIGGGAGLTGMWAGGALGAKAGAAIGTLLLPGVGTAIGGVLGSLAGGAAGYFGAKKAANTTYDAVKGPEKMTTATTEAANKINQTGRVWVDQQGRITTSNGFVINSQNDLMQSFTTLAQAVDFASAKLIAFSGIEIKPPSVQLVRIGIPSTSTAYKEHATGGILTRPHLGLVAEAGPEAIIPLSTRMRSRAMELWQETGRQLGVRPYADGGFAGLIDNTRPVPYSSNVPSSNKGAAFGDINVNISDIEVQMADIDEDELALKIGHRVLHGIKQAIENKAS